MSTISIVIIVVLIGIIIWLLLIAKGILGPWKKKDKWNRKDAEKRARDDYDKRQGL